MTFYHWQVMSEVWNPPSIMACQVVMCDQDLLESIIVIMLITNLVFGAGMCASGANKGNAEQQLPKHDHSYGPSPSSSRA
jgi:hypothetical protein